MYADLVNGKIYYESPALGNTGRSKHLVEDMGDWQQRNKTMILPMSDELLADEESRDMMQGFRRQIADQLPDGIPDGTKYIWWQDRGPNEPYLRSLPGEVGQAIGHGRPDQPEARSSEAGRRGHGRQPAGELMVETEALQVLMTGGGTGGTIGAVLVIYRLVEKRLDARSGSGLEATLKEVGKDIKSLGEGVSSLADETRKDRTLLHQGLEVHAGLPRSRRRSSRPSTASTIPLPGSKRNNE